MTRLYYFILFFLSFTTFNAQIVENFSDGDFTSNPTWTLSAPTDFSVNAGQLKSANTTSNSTFYISTTNTITSNCIWEFWVNLQFATSGSNYVDAYLISDNTNLLASNINGYFVRIGNTNDDISLYKSTVGTQTVIIDGVNSSVASASNNLIKIKVTRSSTNLFTLERDMTGTGSSYFTEGTITDASFNASTSFGFAIKQSTATFFGKHIFDDINVSTIVLDITPPSIVSNTVISSTQLDVLFSEPLDITSTQTSSNYNANNGLGNPSSVTRDASNFSLAHLSFSTPFTNALTNILTVTGVKDIALNAITTETTSFTYNAPITLGYKDVIINELYADPSPLVNLTATEFVELYNRSTNPFNLNGLKLTDGSSTATLGNYTLPPNSYVIICPIADTAQFTALGYMNKLGVSSFPSLNNTGDNLYLKTSFGTFIDSVNYSDTWYQDVVKKNGGWTLELINPNQNINCSQTSNWIASNDNDGGTPGFINSVYSIAPDITGPNIISATVVDATHITVCFNEAIDVSMLTNNSNYVINNSIGSPSLTTAGVGNICAILALTNSLSSNSSYTITISGITDCNGNAIATPTASFNYIVFDTPAFNDVIINEIMVDINPVPNGLPAKQYLELYNKSNKYFNLNGWKFSDGATISTISTNYSFNPNSYVLIAKSADTSGFVGITNKIGTSSFPTYNISGDPVFIYDNSGMVIDSIRYTTNWYKDAIKDDGGWSLELINPLQNSTCLDATNWIASNDANGGTPGVVNSVYSLAPDVTAPKISSVTVLDSLHISVCFDDIISTTQLNTISNYTISNSIGSPSLAVANSGNMCVTLSLSNKLINATNYTISILGITDCSGNTLSPNTKAFSYYNPKAYDVVINELMPDPDPSISLPNEEYVELKNRTNFSINLKNWSFSSLTTTKKLPDITIAPNGYVVLVGSGVANQYLGNFGIVVYEVPSFPSLLNSGTTITLRDTNNVTISSVTYSSSWYNDINKADGGWSLEQIDPNNPCGGQSNWRASNHPNGGTPNAVNSVTANNPDVTAPTLDRAIVIDADTIALLFTEPLDSITLSNPLNYVFDNGLTTPSYVKAIGPQFKKVILKLSSPMQLGIIYNVTVQNGVTDCVGNAVINGSTPFALTEPPAPNDVVINEVLFDPNTGGVDFVELYNRSKKTINLKDLKIGSMDTITNVLKDTEVITDEGYLLFPENYLVISENGTAIKQQYLTPNPKGFLDITDLPSMNTDDDVVTLSDANFVVIDNFKYTAKMHFPLLVSTKGVSLERIDFNRPTGDRTNWNSAAEAVGFATPAYRNSQYLQADGGSGVSISNPLFSPDNDGYNDVLNISYKLDEPGKAANVYIYDSKGRMVRHLVRNEQLATDGVISWNGINDDNEKAPIGIYVVYIELFNLSGKINKYKLSCTLAGKL
jgi:hypothetical protein